MKEEEIRTVRRIGDLLVRATRHFVNCVTAPNRAENQGEENRFQESLIALAEEFERLQ